MHQRPLPALVSLGCYMPTSFRLVRPQTTPYWERYALIPFVTSQTTLSNADWPYKPTRVFLTCFVLTRTLTGKLQYVTHPKTTQSQAHLTVEFLWNGLPKRRCILGSTKNSYKPSFNHAVSYLHDLMIPLIPVWFSMSISCRKPLIVMPCAPTTTSCPRQSWVLQSEYII